MTSEEMGETATSGGGSDFDEHPVASVIHMGRGSFRMEAIALEPELEPGTVQAMTGTVTAPMHATAQDRHDMRHAVDERPSPRPLFGSQVDVPVLAAPTGAVSLHAPVVSLSRAMLATVCGLVLVCGIVVGTAARHLLASPAPLAAPVAALAVPVIAPAPRPAATAASATLVEVAAPEPVVEVPAPVTIRARAKLAAAPAPVARKAAAKPKAWVDPWAE